MYPFDLHFSKVVEISLADKFYNEIKNNEVLVDAILKGIESISDKYTRQPLNAETKVAIKNSLISLRNELMSHYSDFAFYAQDGGLQ